MTVMEDRDLAFMLERSPVLEFLLIMWSQTGVRLRLGSHSLRCLQLAFTYLEYIDVVDAPRLERLFQWETVSAGNSRAMANRSFRIKIGHAPNLRVLGYLEPGGQEFNLVGSSRRILIQYACVPVLFQLVVTLGALQAGSKESIVQILGIEVQFGGRSVVKKVPGFLR